MSGSAPPSCLRCDDTALEALDSPGEGIRFFACPACGRHYTLKDGGALTYRWGNPISLALYPIQFEDEPLAHADRVAGVLRRDLSPAELRAIVDEIDGELARPTQQVRDIIDIRASEPACRDFLAALAACLRAAL